MLTIPKEQPALYNGLPIIISQYLNYGEITPIKYEKNPALSFIKIPLPCLEGEEPEAFVMSRATYEKLKESLIKKTEKKNG